jgi:hypothetical protein
VRVGGEVTKITVDQPAEPAGRDYRIGGVTQQPPSCPKPVETGVKLVCCQRVWEQLSGIQPDSAYAADYLQQVQLFRLERCLDDRKAFTVW